MKKSRLMKMPITWITEEQWNWIMRCIKLGVNSMFYQLGHISMNVVRIIVLNHRIILLILTMAGFMDNMGPCDSYLKDTTTDQVMLSIVSSCGCTLGRPLCRDLNVVLKPDPISWPYRLTCKNTAAPACKTSVEVWTKVYKKVPPKEDKLCFDFYKETQIWAKSCN